MSAVNEINFFFDNLDSKWQKTAGNFDSVQIISAFAAIGAAVSMVMLFSNLDVVRGWHFVGSLILGILYGGLAGGAATFVWYFLVRILQFIFWAVVVVIAITLFIIFLGSIIWRN